MKTLLLLKMFLLTLCLRQSQAQTEYHDKYRTYLANAVDDNTFQDPRILPVLDQSDAITVSVEFQIISISKLDTFTGSMDFAGRLFMRWNNQKVVLTTAQKVSLDFGVRLIDQDLIWTPDLAVYNSMGQRQRLGDSSYRIRIDMDGNCEWLIGVVASTFCTFDVTVFPFDKPSCYISFTTWRYKTDEVLLEAVNDSVDFSLYNENSEWTIENSTSNVTTLDEVTYLNYTISFKRNAGFFLVNVILPLIVVSLLNSLTFLVPTEAGERLTYAILLFLWFCVYLDMISTNMPMSSVNMSTLSLFIISILVLSVFTIFLDIITLSLYSIDVKKPVPVCIEIFVRCLRCRCGGRNENRMVSFDDVDNNDSNTPMLDGKNPTTVAITSKTKTPELRLRDFELPRDDSKTKNVNETERRRKSDEIDWKTVSATFDYIFFVFVLITTLVLCGYFLVPLITANS